MRFLNQKLFSFTPSLFFKNFFSIIAFSLVPKIFAFGKELLIANKVGISQSLDYYLFIVSFISLPLAYYCNGLQNLVIREIKGGENKNDTFIKWLIVFFIISVLLFPVWLLFGFIFLSNEALFKFKELLEESGISYFIYLSYYLLTGINLLFYSLLQSVNLLKLNVFLPVVSSLCFMLMLGLYSGSISTFILFDILFFSTLFESLVLFFISIKFGNLSINVNKIIKTCRLINFSSFKSLIGMSLVSAIPAMIPLFEQYIYIRKGEGVLSAISFSSRIPIALSSLLVSATSVLSVSHFTPNLTSLNKEFLKFEISQVTRRMFLGGVVFTVLTVLLSKSLILLFFNTGAMKDANIDQLASFQTLFFVQIPFLIVNMIYWRLFILVLPSKYLFGISTISGLTQLLIFYTSSFYSLQVMIASNTVIIASLNLFFYKFIFERVLIKQL
ncbi:MAG: hypothetical protein ACK4RX_01835 [Chitinophagaceae bacterium]